MGAIKSIILSWPSDGGGPSIFLRVARAPTGVTALGARTWFSLLVINKHPVLFFGPKTKGTIAEVFTLFPKYFLLDFVPDLI